MGISCAGFRSWRDVFALLALIGIVYGAMVALVQKDFKFVVGYSSVSHMGFVLLGLMTLSQIGLSGAVLQMFSHGILAGLLFAVVGRMVYDRTHTRDLDALEKMSLYKVIPFAAVTFVIAGMASIGLAGLQRVCGRIAGTGWCVAGVSVVAVVAGLGISSASLIRGARWRRRSSATGEGARMSTPLPPISVPERIGAGILIGVALIVGLYPQLMLESHYSRA